MCRNSNIRLAGTLAWHRLDKTYYTFHYQKTLQAGSEGAYLGPPLTFGMRLMGHF
jgi:hypothetical protein